MPGLARAGRVMVSVVVILSGVVLVLFVALLAVSPGRPGPITDDRGRPVAGSLSEKIRVPINGVEQGMFIRGRDPANPVLLFVHGGTGMPEYFLDRQYQSGLEDYFTVCWWERRGAGLSYSPSLSPEAMTVDQIISDTVAVADYLRRRFGRKVYLMAHSGGTFFALQAVARSPESFEAYIGVAQMAHQLRSEVVAHGYMLARFREAGDARMVRRLEAAAPTTTVPLPAAYMAIRDAAMHRLGIGTTRQMRSVITGVFLPSLRCREYTVAEKLNIWRGKLFSDRLLWDTMLATDLTRMVTRVAVPVYFVHGAHDYTVTLPETRAFFDDLEAPVKGFYTFPQSAHSPMFEEPVRLREIIEHDVLRGTNGLADRSEAG